MEMKTDFDKIFNAIGEMRQDFTNQFEKLNKRIDKIETEQIEMKQFMDVQFEAIRQGLVKSYNQYNQLISEISQNRSAIFSTKVAVGELQETVYLMTRNMNQPI